MYKDRIPVDSVMCIIMVSIIQCDNTFTKNDDPGPIGTSI